MATTYTPHYNLGKQTNHADKFSMDVITDDMDIIDTELYNNATEINKYAVPDVRTDRAITSGDIQLFADGIMVGTFSSDCTGLPSDEDGVLHAYYMNPGEPGSIEIVQVLELPDAGTILMRHKLSSWSNWIQATQYKKFSHNTITNSTLENFKEGIIGGVLSTEITGGASNIDGIVRAHHTTSNLESIQIAEAVDGTRKTRYWLTDTTWSPWV